MTETISLPQLCVLESLAAVTKQYGKRWCVVSRETIGGLMRSHYNVTRSTKTITRCTTYLVNGGYITKQYRKKWVPGVGRVYSANLYKLTGKGYKLLKRLCFQLVWIVGGPRGTNMSPNSSLHSVNDARGRPVFQDQASSELKRPPPNHKKRDSSRMDPDQMKKIAWKNFWSKRNRPEKAPG